MQQDVCVGTIVCKLAPDRKRRSRGYIAMLAVDKEHRKRGIGAQRTRVRAR
jgi:peptide alpha-N-acetyltransferase